MRKPWTAYKGWNDKRWARIRARGAWYIFLHSLVAGLVSSICWIVVMLVGDVIRGHFRADDWPLLIICGLAFGLVMASVAFVGNVNESRYEKMKELQSKHSL